MKKSLLYILALAIVFQMFSMNKPSFKMKGGRWQMKKLKVEDNTVSKTPYTGYTGSYFDKSANGAGWYQGYNRKVAWDIGGSFAGPMIGSVYRKLYPTTGSGTIGGLVAEWSGTDMNYSNQIVMDSSPNWPSTTPGGRYPYTTAFINGYLFGQFADINYDGGTFNGGFPVFAVADASFGYDFAVWDIATVAATDGGASPDPVISCTGDVTYDQATGYYYWIQTWDDGELADACVKSIIVGRSLTPYDASSWVWSDYNDFILDATDDTSGFTDVSDVMWSYCKDRYGNGTGYGIGITVANDVDDYVLVDSTEVLLNPKLSYVYTTNWGGDDSSGDWTHNWITDTDNKWFQLDMKDVFDWYGSTMTEIDTTVNDTMVTVFNDPYITWNISTVATENNVVHVLVRAFGGTYEGDNAGYLIYANDDDYIAGYYHIRGVITDSGVQWRKAVPIASNVGMDTNEIEWVYSNFNTMTIGYAGFGQVYATWLDRPVNRPTLAPSDWSDADEVYMDDGFLSYSCNDGDTWEIPDGGHLEIEYTDDPGHIYNLYYAQNVTNTGTLHEDGWACATTGKIVMGEVEMFAASQYYDVSNPIQASPTSSTDYEQFLHIWKVTGAISDSTGINTEHVAISDYELIQNYPNPFNPSTEIGFKISSDSDVKLTIFNSNGALVSELINSRIEKGYHKVEFNGSSLNSGVYFYQLTVNGLKSTKKMVLAK